MLKISKGACFLPPAFDGKCTHSTRRERLRDIMTTVCSRETGAAGRKGEGRRDQRWQQCDGLLLFFHNATVRMCTARAASTAPINYPLLLCSSPAVDLNASMRRSQTCGDIRVRERDDEGR